MIFAGAYDEII